MNFDEATSKKKYYSSIQELLNNNKRKDIFMSFESVFTKIKMDMFDEYDVEDIYLYGDILEKEYYDKDGLSLLIEIKKSNFEKMVDAKYIQDCKFKIDFVFDVEGQMYSYKNKRWIIENNPPGYKILI